jgi:membrane-associated HD superfamily phosphohydrolase
MLFQLPYDLTTKTIAWSVPIALALIVGIYFMFQSRQIGKSNPSVGKIKQGYGIFLIGWGVCRIFFSLSDYVDNLYGQTSFAYTQLLLTGYVLLVFAFTLLIYAIETRIQASSSLLVTKFLGVMVGVLLVLWVVAIVDPSIVATARIIGFAIGIVLGLIVIVFYVRLAILSTGQVRTRVIVNFLAFCLIFAGHTLDSAFGTQTFPWINTYIWFPAVLSALGVICFYLSQKGD